MATTIIRQMTRRAFSYEGHDFSYRLPFPHAGSHDEELVKQWVEWVKQYPGGRAECKSIQRDEEGYVRLSFYMKETVNITRLLL